MGINEEVFSKKAEVMNSEYIKIDAKKSTITLAIQNGPIKENGVNGCQIDDLGKIWRGILKGFNTKFPCRENSITITKLDEALMWQEKRKQEREERGVEGYNKS